jgi:hypothetical protein
LNLPGLQHDLVDAQVRAVPPAAGGINSIGCCQAAARGGRAILNEAIPEVEPHNNTISRRIDLGQVLDDAVFRSGKHDPIGLGQQVLLSGNASFLPAALINRPGVGSSIARGLYGAGNGAGTAADAVQHPGSRLLQQALMAYLAGGDPE